MKTNHKIMLDGLKRFGQALWEAIAMPYIETTTHTISAVDWYAVYASEEELTYYPLIGWQVIYQDGQPLQTHGLVFVDNQPPITAYAEQLPQFVGYRLNREFSTRTLDWTPGKLIEGQQCD